MELMEIGAIAAIINGMIIQPLWFVIWLKGEKDTKKEDTKWW